MSSSLTDVEANEHVYSARPPSNRKKSNLDSLAKLNILPKNETINPSSKLSAKKNFKLIDEAETMIQELSEKEKSRKSQSRGSKNLRFKSKTGKNSIDSQALTENEILEMAVMRPKKTGNHKRGISLAHLLDEEPPAPVESTQKKFETAQ